MPRLSAPFLCVSVWDGEGCLVGAALSLLCLGMRTTCCCKCRVAASLQVPWASGKERWGGQTTAAEEGVMLDEGYSVFQYCQENA